MNLFGIGITELIFVLVIALFVLGPMRMIELAKRLGGYLAELRKALFELTRLMEVEKSEQEPADTVAPEGIARQSKTDDKDEART
ncbi:MAG: sec-independent protein translocase protein TatA/sec-independent protein translocase protein TatB [Chloroflexi bacterium]|jgi:sec-independent protein translocase protein TatA/sec-independent protein translocase protein TatB|nr:MAG: sec-independent protein translocase protein TatA/sec-independent protein translocase protein TatB [Chloroflexota bacterium]